MAKTLIQRLKEKLYKVAVITTATAIISAPSILYETYFRHSEQGREWFAQVEDTANRFKEAHPQATSYELMVEVVTKHYGIR